jgi:cysteine synthase A
VRLRRLVPPHCPRIVVKVEVHNPTGSMKDRMARSMVARAEADGRLRPGDTVVEYTGGSTGASLGLVCAAKGYRLRVVSSNAFSQQKLAQMAAYGAEVTVIHSRGGLITRQLIEEMIDTAKRYAAEPGYYWTDQLTNADSIAGYHPMGQEIWDQTGGRLDAFVHSVGTMASLQAVATVLRHQRPDIRIIAVEPGESAVLSGGPPGAHRIEGIGIGQSPPMWRPELVDDIIPIPSTDAEAMTRRLAAEEGLFAGTSSGANVLAAIDIGRRLGPDATVATLLVDSGLKYLDTSVYHPHPPTR